ncbi:PaaI family thioesterase [Granulicella tundricola]|uniref:Acyl-coenzyme A thioesterase THEM4 n=1 Tax=Granulicella tundricola (strain ATCC BAA-1859 / DSM 23138 / MP5ACTX9) TaxID=1198114 RepID=E8WX06_GRATM|nr:PaaI family thioesterase [Granulicella tundricola]ADW68567.1 thioesterase superfamily protein [Granulicella tundricola MP5ACTX9]
MPPESHLPAGKTLDEQASHCFGCSPINPIGLQLTFTLTTEAENITATATVQLTRNHEGPPGYLHGGIIATLMDEAMSKLNRPLNLIAMTRNLEVDYLRPCPIETPLTLTAHHLHREGRKLFHSATLTHPDGTVLATAKGLFLAIDPALLNRRQP